MTIVYGDEDYLSALKQKRKLFFIYVAVAAFYALICIGLLIYFASQPYQAPVLNAIRWVIAILTIAFVVFSYPYLGIKYKRISAYCAMLRGFNEGLKEKTEGEFFGFFEGKEKDGVDADLCIIRNWNEKKHVYDERQYYIDREKPVPPFETGDYVRLILQGNVLIAYEILEKGVMA